MCKIKQFIKIRNNYCEKELSVQSEINQCIMDTKESLDLTDNKLTIKKEACWDIYVFNDLRSLVLLENDLNNQYYQDLACKCNENVSNPLSFKNCACCFKSNDTHVLSANEIEVSGKREDEIIG